MRLLPNFRRVRESERMDDSGVCLRTLQACVALREARNPGSPDAGGRLAPSL
jgi:hypothetical protein